MILATVGGCFVAFSGAKAAANERRKIGRAASLVSRTVVLAIESFKISSMTGIQAAKPMHWNAQNPSATKARHGGLEYDVASTGGRRPRGSARCCPGPLRPVAGLGTGQPDERRSRAA